MVSLKNSLQYLLLCQSLWRAALIISAVAIMYLATTSDPYPIPSASSDKLNHVLAFIELTILSRLSWPELSRVWVTVGVMVFGLAIELTQGQLPHRDFSLLDLSADGAGIAIGLLLCACLFSQVSAETESRL